MAPKGIVALLKMRDDVKSAAGGSRKPVMCRGFARSAPRFAMITACSLAMMSGAGLASEPPRAPEIVETEADPGYLSTIIESLFGDGDSAERWSPLSARTFFSEGWLEPWAKAPSGKTGLTPRQGWLGAFDGLLYRLSLVTTFNDISRFNVPFGGNRYALTYTAFLPLSRRFELIFGAPLLVSNGTTNPRQGYTTRFGDLTITPRFLLSDTKASSQVLAVGVRTPTGTPATFDGHLALSPRYEFWANPAGAWVLRGADGFLFPLNTDRAKVKAKVTDSFTGGLAIGRYLRPRDVPFGQLVIYCEANYTVPLDQTSTRNTTVTVGPGTRFHLVDDFFFLGDLALPVTGARVGAFGFQCAILKVF